MFGWNTNKVKFIYDLAMLAVAAALVVILRRWNGIGIGTVLAAFIDAPLITLFGKWLDKHFTFESRFKFTDKLK